MITLFANEGLDWARERIPKLEAWMGEPKSLAAMEGDRILGVVVFDAFTPYDVNMHIVIEDRRCVTRRILKQVFSYPFKQLGMRRVTGLVPASNVAALAFDLRLGFRHEGRKIHGAGDEDEIVLGMVAEGCPWL
jgi:RimJ/RimL family protein N-acetyltransferase